MATQTATIRGQQSSAGDFGDANREVVLIRTIEATAAASGDTVDFQIRIPTYARISLASRLYWDDLATSGSPTLDLGLYAVSANVTSDDDALSNGHALTTATATGAMALTEIASAGLPAWDLVANVTADPGGFLDVKGIVRDAATTATGTVTLELRYVIP